MVEEIASERLRELIESGESVQVVDIRSRREFEQGHIPGAVNLPFQEFSRRIGEFDWRDSIVVACPIGRSSLQAARLLESFEGVPEDAWIANLEGGYRDWEYDLETGET